MGSEVNIVSLTYSVGHGALERLKAQPGDFSGKVHRLARHMATLDQIECPVTHRFSPGLYLREIFMPAGSIVIGKIHKTEHFNFLMKGRCLIVHEDFSQEELRAPMVFVSKAGVQKVLHILEDMVWLTTHVTEETDLVKLEELLITPQPLEQLT